MNTNLYPKQLYAAFRKTADFLTLPDEDMEKNVAENINKKYYDIELPPIWPDKIAIAERILIKLKNMPKNCMSFLDKKNKIIYLTNDANLLEKWENFALAHVLGKLFLGHEDSSFNPATVTDMSGSREDRQANKFASYLLMPDKFVKEYAWLEEEFANVFRVPQKVVDLRMSLS